MTDRQTSVAPQADPRAEHIQWTTPAVNSLLSCGPRGVFLVRSAAESEERTAAATDPSGRIAQALEWTVEALVEPFPQTHLHRSEP